MNTETISELKTHVLKPTQRESLRFIYWYQHDRGYPPTLREMGRAFGITSSHAVFCRIRHLERYGYVTHVAGRSRTLLVTEKGLRALGQSNDPWPFSRVEREQ